MASPLKQFEIKTIAPIEVGGIDVSFTNSSLFMAIVITAITLFLVLGMRKKALVPGRWQSLAELCYEFIAGLVRDNVGKDGRAYFPFIFSLFMFILFANSIAQPMPSGSASAGRWISGSAPGPGLWWCSSS